MAGRGKKGRLTNNLVPLRMYRALQEYYNNRAPEYDAVYTDTSPERKAELAELSDAMREALRGRRVLEIACGTGYWTAKLSGHAASVSAADISPEMLGEARKKNIPAEQARFFSADAYDLCWVPGEYNGGMANFWVSHVPRARLQEFLAGFHAKLSPGAQVFMADNVFVEGFGGELVRNPAEIDTYKRRELQDGGTHMVLKNYFSAQELKDLFSKYTGGLHIHSGHYYWWISYTLPA